VALTIPATPNFIASRFYLKNNTQLFQSSLSSQVQRRTLTGSFWMAEYSLPSMARANWSAWQAFFNELQGRRNTFNGFCPDSKVTQGTSTGTPLIKGASQTGNSVTTDGWSLSTAILKAGDFISFGGELKQVSADVSSDGAGDATITFQPSIRTSPSDDATITINNTTCEMILLGNDINFATTINGVSQPLTFAALEVIS